MLLFHTMTPCFPVFSACFSAMCNLKKKKVSTSTKYHFIYLNICSADSFCFTLEFCFGSEKLLFIIL